MVAVVASSSLSSSLSSSKRSFSLFHVVITVVIGFLLGRLTAPQSFFSLSSDLLCPTTMTTATTTATSSSTLPPPPAAQASAIVAAATTVEKGKNFLEIAVKYNNDKAMGIKSLEKCNLPTEHVLCPAKRQNAVNPECRIVGHFYQRLYQQWLGPFSLDTTDPFLFIEIGFGQGNSVPLFNEFLPRADRHILDIACQNMDKVSPKMAAKYKPEMEKGRLHCGSSADFDFLHSVYRKLVTERPDGPPLRVVIEDASHIPSHMAVAVFFWLPRLEPGGLLFLEDIEPNVSTKHGGHGIQSDFMPQLMSDIHYCGDEFLTEDSACFPQIQGLIQSIHCALHICVIQRNDVPASDPPREQSMPPPHALDLQKCLGKKK